MFPFFVLYLSAAIQPQGHLGVHAVVVGEAGSVATLHPDDRFPMQSVYKFPIGMAVLHAVDVGKLKLDQPVKVRTAEFVPAALHSPIRDQHPEGDFTMPLREILRYAVSESDGTASDVLLRVLGGPSKVQSYLGTLGISDLRVVTTEMAMSKDDKAQYRNWATPRAAVALLAALQEGRGLSAGSRAYLLKIMTETPTGPMRLRGRLPVEAQVAHKTGTSRTVKGVTAATNDIGLVTLPNGKVVAIAVFVSDSPDDAAVREGFIAETAREVWDRIGAR